MPVLEFNSILEIQSAVMPSLLQQLLAAGYPFAKILDALFARFSSMSVQDLFRYIDGSTLVSGLQILNELVVSEAIYDVDLRRILQDIFDDFSDQNAGQEHLFAVLVLVQLMQVPTNDVTPEEDNKIEALKLLFRSTMFDDGIVVQFMGFRDEYEQRARRCPCPDCNANFIFSIGWYIAAQNAHNENAFVGNAG
jgi:hypothetical protein